MTASPRGTTLPAGLFERLGGFDAVERTVGRLLARIGEDPVLASLLPAGNHDALSWGMQLLLTDRLGGPMAYDGPDLAEMARRCGLDAPRWRAVLGHTLACLALEVPDPATLEEAKQSLESLGESVGLTVERGTEPRDSAAQVIAQAEALVSGRFEGWNLFVLNRDLVLIHESPAAAAAVQACDAELKRSCGLGAADLPGQSILRFHPAPTRLQVMLGDGSRLPQETTWAFGRVVWKAVMHALRSPDGALAGFAMLWQDESEVHQRRAVVERLRAESEDLPVPVMFPGSSLEHWFGNAACEHALQRLSPYLARPVNPLEGVPVQLFLPDEGERDALFANPANLPFKRQVRIGPETIAILVSPVLDEQQRYVVPQITWEIVYVTRQPAVVAEVPVPAAPAVAAPPPTPPAAPAASSPASSQLRAEARALEAATQELLLLSRMLLTVADDTDAQLHSVSIEAGDVATAAVRSESETGQVAEAALAVLAAAHEVPVGHQRRDETARALATLTGIARRANRLALDGALLAVQDEAATQAGELASESHSFARGLIERVRALSARAQSSSEALRSGSATAGRLAALRAQLGESEEGAA